ncbi:MAG: nucleotidyl transferase AbiEii/AbiGii toxin family protein [Mariniphaga sp.]|nr:nucleotidyl transferase AbiEii/AbiGii toxin family protein [Mariniphaga sp.]MDD4426742.1 nucleotidyl transferase AbiEii/AbiGii toxin family protein [Mariniphaga sp.]
MLHKETIDQPTLELLKKLQQKKYLKDFFLVGGTALALLYGHRKSVDIDLFSNFSFDTERLLENLSSDFQFQLFFSAENTIKGSINGTQVDIIAHRYPLIRKPVKEEGISILAVEDIAAMKLNAIAVSGQRVKDFIDIYYLLDYFSLHELISFYKEKYTRFNEVNVLKSITWFNDVALEDWPVILKDKEINWDEVKNRIIKETEIYLEQL